MRRNHDLRRNSDVSMAAMLMHEMYRSMEPSRRHAALRRISDVVGPDVVRDYLVAYEDTMQEVNQRMPEPQMPQREFSQQSHKHSPGVQHNEATDNGRVNADGCDVEGRSNPRSTGFQHEHANTGTHDDEASAHNNSGATGSNLQTRREKPEHATVNLSSKSSLMTVTSLCQACALRIGRRKSR